MFRKTTKDGLNITPLLDYNEIVAKLESVGYSPESVDPREGATADDGAHGRIVGLGVLVALDVGPADEDATLADVDLVVVVGVLRPMGCSVPS